MDEPAQSGRRVRLVNCALLTDTAEPELLIDQGTPRRANDTRLSAAWRALEDPSIAAVTADVFDTLVFRTVRTPVDAFPLIGAELAARGLLASRLPPDSFGPLRVEAERAARRRLQAATGSHEVTLREIYEAFPAWARAGDERLHELIAVEVEVERQVCVPDLEVAALLDAAREAGKRVVLVSDNYLGATHLRAILSQPPLGGLALHDIYCSCDHRVGKGGGLWPLVIEDLGVRPEQILHIGDNPRDDIAVPGELGVRTVFYEQRPAEDALALETERRLVAAADARPLPRGVPGGSDFGLTALRGKALGTGWDVPEGAGPFWRCGASVLGPTFSGFATWIAREARLLGFDAVHCLMREGEFLSELVRTADEGLRGPEHAALDVVPLWLNRQTCLVAAMGALDEEGLRAAYAGRTSLTLRQALALVGLSVADVPAIAGHADTRLDDETLRTSVLTLLGEDPELQAKAAAHAREQRRRVVALLERAAGPRRRVLLVDLGWGASIQHLADRCLRAEGSYVHTCGLYLLTHDGAAPRMVDGTEAYSFLADCGGPEDLTRMVMRSPEIIEQVCTADVGSQLGLTADLEPITEPLDERLAGQRQQIGWVRRGIRSFQDLHLQYATILPDRLGDLADARPQLLAQLARLLIAPTVTEAAVFGDWQHDEGKGSTRLDPLASADRVTLVAHATPRQLVDLPMRDLYWPFGLAGRAAEHHHALLAAVSAGLLPWEATESTVAIGQAELLGVEGHWGDDEHGAPRPAPRVQATPTRNLAGNSYLRLSLQAPDLQVITLQPGYKPHLLRLDWLHVRLWEQGRAEPRELVLADGDRSADALTQGYVSLSHNTYAAPGPRAAFVLDLRPLRDAVTYAVDVEVGFAAMEMPARLGEQLDVHVDQADLQRARATVTALESSLSWRVTRPLRRLKRLR
jgi:FMN phosphatase YigB (HAD superfamily)